MFNDIDKIKIGKLLMEQYQASHFYGSKEKFAKSLGLVVSDMTNVDHEKWKAQRHLIGYNKWIKIARLVGYNPTHHIEWKSANTYVKEFMYKQFALCKKESLTAMLVDEAGIGKTFAAKTFAKETKGVFYIDCSVTNRKTEFIKALGKAVGVGSQGRVNDILQDSIYALGLMEKPFLILDEAGDLDNKAVLIVKQIYNALEDVCGIYLIGADGLKSKIQSGIINKSLGYVEVFSRFGKRFGKALPEALDEKKEVLKQMAEAIIVANGIHKKEDIKNIVSKLFFEGMHDMRKIKREILKIRNN